MGLCVEIRYSLAFPVHSVSTGSSCQTMLDGTWGEGRGRFVFQLGSGVEFLPFRGNYAEEN